MYHLSGAIAIVDVLGTINGRAIEYQSRPKACHLLRHGRDG